LSEDSISIYEILNTVPGVAGQPLLISL